MAEGEGGNYDGNTGKAARTWRLNLGKEGK